MRRVLLYLYGLFFALTQALWPLSAVFIPFAVLYEVVLPYRAKLWLHHRYLEATATFAY